MNEELHETLCVLFIEIQKSWTVHCPASRTNFLNYNWIYIHIIPIMYFVGPSSALTLYSDDEGQGKTVGPRYELEESMWRHRLGNLSNCLNHRSSKCICIIYNSYDGKYYEENQICFKTMYPCDKSIILLSHGLVRMHQIGEMMPLPSLIETIKLLQNRWNYGSIITW